MVCFVSVEDGCSLDAASKRTVRSEVMRLYRRQERGDDDQNAQHPPRLNGADAWRARRRKLAGAKPGSSQSRALQGRRTHAVQTYGTQVSHRLGPGLVQNGEKSLNQGSTGRFEVFLSPSFTSMDDKYVYRMAIVASFAAGYFPTGLDSSTLSQILSGWTAVQSPAMEAGNDALGLLYVGHAYNDPRMILAGRKRHALASSLLRADLSRCRTNDEGVIAAAQDLLSCEIYTSVSSGLHGCSVHLKGLAALVDRAQKIPGQSTFKDILTVQYYHTNMMYGLVSRRGASEVNDPPGVRDFPPGSVGRLMEMARSLTRMLEQSDRVCKSATNSEAITRGAQKKLSSLEVGIVAWLKQYMQLQHRPQYGLASEAGPEAVKGSAQPQFASFIDAVVQCFHSCLLLLLRQCSLRLQIHSYHRDARGREDARADACASNLRSGLDYISSTAGSRLSEAMAVRASYYFLEGWYKWTHDKPGVLWCQPRQEKLQAELPFIDWDALLPWTFIAVHWI